MLNSLPPNWAQTAESHIITQQMVIVGCSLCIAASTCFWQNQPVRPIPSVTERESLLKQRMAKPVLVQQPMHRRRPFEVLSKIFENRRMLRGTDAKVIQRRIYNPSKALAVARNVPDSVIPPLA